MLRKKARNPVPQEQGRMSEHLPWLVHVSPELILCKDGSLLAAYELAGVDIDEDATDKLERAVRELQDAIQALDERFYVWMSTDKRYKREADEPPLIPNNPVHQVLEDHRNGLYASDRVFTIMTHVFMVFTGDTGVYKFMENIKQRMSEDGANIWSAILYSLNPANAVKSAVLHDAMQMDANMDLAEMYFAGFVNAQTACGLRRLSGVELDSVLYRMANPTLPNEKGIELSPTSMLDSGLAASDLKFGREVFSVAGPDRTSYGYTVSLNGYPINSSVFIAMLAIEAEFRITHVIKCLSIDAARGEVQEHADYYRMTQSTLAQRISAYLTGQPAEVDPGKADLYNQCLDALRRNMAENLGFAYHSLNICFFEDSPNNVQMLASAILRSIGGLPCIRERLGIKAALLSTLPGQWAHNQRLMLANTEVISNTCPLSAIPPGESVSEHLSSVYGRPVAAMATFSSRLGTEIHFDPFIKQVGHSMLVMPTGGGKTTFVNYCLSCFSRYPDAQVIIFDRDHSCRILTKLIGGTHIDLKNSVALNPLAHIRDSEIELLGAREFIVRRIEEGGDVLAAEDRAEIYNQLKQLASSTQELSLATLYHLLPLKLRTALGEWVQGGPFGFFGSSSDSLELSAWTCIEMKEIMKVDRLSRAFLDHAFASISRRLDGRPTFIYVEEASFALSNPSFLAGIDDWLKTFRKKNAMVWLTVQSPQSISGVNVDAVRATLTDNVPNLILGYNNRLESHRELYRHMFGLSDDQVSMIGQLQPQREYLRIASNICRVLSTQFDQNVLAAVRSEAHYQKLLDELEASGATDWRSQYLSYAAQRG